MGRTPVCHRLQAQEQMGWPAAPALRGQHPTCAIRHQVILIYTTITSDISEYPGISRGLEPHRCLLREESAARVLRDALRAANRGS